jgi:uncharacterized membrane protein
MLRKKGDDDHELVLIAAYRDLETAQVDFDEVERRLKHGMEMRAAALVSNNADGVAEVVEATNRHGKVAVGVGTGLGALVGLFAPPLGLSLLVGAAAGGLLGVFAQHELHTHLHHEVGEALEAGTAVILAVVYPHGREPMELTLQSASAFRELRLDKSTINEIEGVITDLMEKIKIGTPSTSS